MSALRNSDMFKGSAIQVFVTDDQNTDKCIAFATSQSITFGKEFIDISTKSHGDWAASLPTITTWSVTSDCVYSTTTMKELVGYCKSNATVTIKFAEVQNYAHDYGTVQEGIVDNQNADWAISTNVIASGKAYIESHTINADAGSEATMSVTFKGIGEFESVVDD